MNLGMNNILIFLELLGMASFLFISMRLLVTYRRTLVYESLFLSVSFLLLAIGQVCSALSIFIDDVKISIAFYVATASTAIAAFSILIATQRYNRITLYAITFTLVGIAMPDFFAGLLSTITTLNSIGFTRFLISLLSASYYLRAVSVILGVELSPIVLLTAEIVRSISAAALALHSSLKVLPYGQKKE